MTWKWCSNWKFPSHEWSQCQASVQDFQEARKGGAARHRMAPPALQLDSEALHPKRNESNVEQLLREWDTLKRGATLRLPESSKASIPEDSSICSSFIVCLPCLSICYTVLSTHSKSSLWFHTAAVLPVTSQNLAPAVMLGEKAQEIIEHSSALRCLKPIGKSCHGERHGRRRTRGVSILDELSLAEARLQSTTQHLCMPCLHRIQCRK